MTWSNHHSIGVAEIDIKRKCFIKLLTCLNAMRIDDAIKLELLPEIRSASKMLFSIMDAEEAHMRDRDYERLAEHISDHNKAESSILCAIAYGQETEDSLQMLIRYMMDWFSAHADVYDSAYREWLGAKRPHFDDNLIFVHAGDDAQPDGALL